MGVAGLHTTRWECKNRLLNEIIAYNSKLEVGFGRYSGYIEAD